MPLVLSLKSGDIFNIGIRRFAVQDISHSDIVHLQEVGGATYTLTKSSSAVVDSYISLQLSDQSGAGSCRIMFHVPGKIPVWRKDRPSTADISLLAPVPLVHLESALKTVAEAGRVAFSSEAFDVFNTVDAIREDKQVTVYIYPSHAHHLGLPKVRWTANYVQQLQPKYGRHPEAKKYRPESTQQDPREFINAVYWEVTDLKKLNQGEEIGMDRFVAYGKNKAYQKNFKPHGPHRVEPMLKS